jgi:hypothetical protein
VTAKELEKFLFFSAIVLALEPPEILATEFNEPLKF